MGASSSVQFRGKGRVVEAYTNRGVDVWAVFQSKTLLTKGIGVDELETYLGMLDKAETTAIYILKVYEEVTDPKKVKEKTEADGSFYFRLVDEEEYREKKYGFIAEFDQRMTAMDEKFNSLMERLNSDIDEENEPETIGTIITGILSDPEKLEKTIGVVQRLLGMNQQPTYGRQIGNVNILDSNITSLSPSPTMQPMAQQQQQPANEEEKLTRLAAAIDTLEKCDTQLIPHLEKLAKIASQNPAQFQTLISMLDVF